MLRVSDSKLHHIRQQVVRQLPLPEEMTVALDLLHLQELLETIQSVPDGEDFDLMVARLPRRQLNDLFGLLLVMESSTSEQVAGDEAGSALAMSGSSASATTATLSTDASTAHAANAATAAGTASTQRGIPSQAGQQSSKPSVNSLRSTLSAFFRQAAAAKAPIVTPESMRDATASSAGYADSPTGVPASTGNTGKSTTQTTAAIARSFLSADAALIQERIYRILERRATLSLAMTGWAFYQQHFFHAELAEAMSRISRALVAKGEKEPLLHSCHQLGSGENLPERIAERWVADLEKPVHALNKVWLLDDHLHEIAAFEGSRFATLLLHAFFLNAPLERVASEAERFGSCLELATVDEQAQLLNRIYGEYRLEPAYAAMNQMVLRHCGLPRKGDTNAVWGLVTQPVRQHFRQWALIDLLSRQIDGQARKQTFYQPLQMRLFDCQQLSPDVLLMAFPQFYLVDHKAFSHQVIYYDRPTLEMALEAKTLPDDLAIPPEHCVTAREVVLNQTRANKAVLKLEEVNLLYARDFIESMMNPTRRGPII